MNTLELFATPNTGDVLVLAPGITLIRGFAQTAALMPLIESVAARAPFRHLVTPGGQTMSVAMTNCGPVGWVSDRLGYRYSSRDPLTDQDWPPMPEAFVRLALDAATRGGFPDFVPDACLVNRYSPGSRLTAHRDADEQNYAQPLSRCRLALPASFAFYGSPAAARENPSRSSRRGDVLVWAGPRLVYHAVRPVKPGSHPLTGAYRYNLTFRHAR
jgi:alkylated DNA repair protein (DNA oxidative demethylase)